MDKRQTHLGFKMVQLKISKKCPPAPCNFSESWISHIWQCLHIFKSVFNQQVSAQLVVLEQHLNFDHRSATALGVGKTGKSHPACWNVQKVSIGKDGSKWNVCILVFICTPLCVTAICQNTASQLWPSVHTENEESGHRQEYVNAKRDRTIISYLTAFKLLSETEEHPSNKYQVSAQITLRTWKVTSAQNNQNNCPVCQNYQPNITFQSLYNLTYTWKQPEFRAIHHL